MSDGKVRTWSEHQNRIFDFVTDDTGNTSIEAVAGSGKTTTIVEAANRLPVNSRSLFLAFNKSIATELATRLRANVTAKTLNSLGHGAWTRLIRPKRVNLDSNKTRNIMGVQISAAEQKTYGSGVSKMVALAKCAGLVPQGLKQGPEGIIEDSQDAWYELMDQYDIDFVDERANPDYAIDLARDILRESIKTAWTQVIDFDDQLYMTVIYGAPVDQHDFVFVDEAQDLNPIQHRLLAMALKPEGRLIAVGDPRQAIYGFRGADAASMGNLQQTFRTVTLPLSISYRCSQEVVKEAQKLVPHIQSSPTAPVGLVKTVDKYWPDTFRDSDAIICRNVKPIITMAFAMIRANRACRVLGRDIGVGLQTLVKKMNATSIDQLEDKLAGYLQRETDKLQAKGQEGKAEMLRDKVETVQVFIDQLTEDNRTVEGLNARIDSLFNDSDRGKLTLATIHKSKGLEWDRVFILDRKLMPSKYARQQWQIEQEKNIHYVAVTRARQELYYIDTEGLQLQQPPAKKVDARPWTPEDDKKVGDSDVTWGELFGKKKPAEDFGSGTAFNPPLTDPSVIDGQYEEVLPAVELPVMRQCTMPESIATLPQWAQDYIAQLQQALLLAAEHIEAAAPAFLPGVEDALKTFREETVDVKK